jgi:hypothetical protein
LARAQTGVPVFSLDWRSPTVSFPDFFTATPITEGDVLAPAFLVPMIGAMPTPGIVESGGFGFPLGLAIATHAGCVGHVGGTPCAVEVDALSHALDPMVQCTGSPIFPPPTWAFSVGPRSLGFPGSPAFPNVLSEAACGEEGADVFHSLGIPCGPVGVIPPLGNNALIDGNGFASCSGAVYPGWGLIEPAPGDNVDAMDLDLPDPWVSQTTCTYFSLDSGFLDPLWNTPNSGSAAANGFVGGDVLVSCPGCSPTVYAAAGQLGLDLGGPDTDDLDGLVLRENGIAGYQRSVTPYDWVTGATDMLFFSVRRGSAIVGQPDSFFGVPIEPGDILVPTGPSGSLPGIWVSAESLGLATSRSNAIPIGDDIDALDVLHDPWPGTGFCFGDGSGTACPCANFGAPGRGCGNINNPLGGLLWANGYASISNDTVHFTVSGLTSPNQALTILVQGTGMINNGAGAQFGDGLKCLNGQMKRLYKRNLLCGNREYGYSVPGDLQVSVAGNLGGPGPMNYQVWYRNGGNFCTASTLNFTNAYRIVWIP